MKSNGIRKGTVVWVLCEIRSGPFPNELRVYIKLDDHEWFGFVDLSQLRDKVDEGTDYVRATIIAIQDERVVLGIRGETPVSRPIETRSSVIGGFSTVSG